MRCATLNKLPTPSPYKSGWPWTDESSQSAEIRSDASLWPRISIVTPSYNQGQFLEETIRSVLLQGYPNLEYIIIDGGSTDDSMEIIKKYEPWFSYWVSEPDCGQSQALNKGFRLATGEILAWLNSDDRYLPNALHFVGTEFSGDNNLHWLVANHNYIDEKGSVIGLEQLELRTPSGHAYRILKNGNRFEHPIHQPASFWSRDFWEQAGPLDETLKYVMDQALWFRAAVNGFMPRWESRALAEFRFHMDSKTIGSLPEFDLELSRLHYRMARQPAYLTLPNLLLAIQYFKSASEKKLGHHLKRVESWRALIWLFITICMSPRRLHYWLFKGKQILQAAIFARK